MTKSRPRPSRQDPQPAATLLLADDEARELVRGAQRRDRHACTRLYQIYADRIYRYTYYRIGERARAEELTAELFVRLLENIGDFRFGPRDHAMALTGWIYRIAHNLVVDEYRRQQVRGLAEPFSEDLDEELDSDLPEDFHLTRADLQIALTQLTDEQQTVVILRFAEGMTGAEIGEVLGKPETAVKALQRRALAKLKRYLR